MSAYEREGKQGATIVSEATTDGEVAADDVPKKRSKMPIILGLVLALIGGGGGFMAVQMGLVGGSHETADGGHAPDPLEPLPPVAFVALEPLLISLPSRSGHQYLRFVAQIEVAPEFASDVESIKPRIVDVLNGYLRAVEVSDFDEPAALMRLRAQMLRRVQVIAGEGRVRDLLIMEFVLS
ncbi:MAG: flagellar FliL protein [Paracoccaceae bacterium]